MNQKIFTKDEINNDYKIFIEKNSNNFSSKIYLSEFENLNLSWKIGSENFKFSPSNKDFPRVKAIIDFNCWIKKWGLQHVSNLLITDKTDPEISFLEYDSIQIAKYDGINNDLHDISTFTINKDTKFDLIIFNQTIEHLYNPNLAIGNLKSLLKDGGFIYTSVPTLSIPHMVPFHFSGLTSMGLIYLFKNNGFNICEVGQFGNQDYLTLMYQNSDWPDYQKLLVSNKKQNWFLNLFKKDASSYITNDINFSAQTWILARK